MKKALMAACFALACAAVTAQETAPASAKQLAASAPDSVAEKASWPVWLDFNSVENVDIAGLHLNIFYGRYEGVTGLDLGFYGCARYAEGLQVNILRNEARDVLAGIQVGIYNTAGRADVFGIQVGLFNEANSIRGVQVGLINVANKVDGIQVGLVNRAESAYGFQVGGVNVIRDSELSFCPIVNIGFDEFPNY